MRKLVLKELHLCSFSEKKAKKICFHEGKNLVLGNNRTGKSSIIKTIFWTLGADVKQHPKWKSLNVYSLLKFSFNDVNYGLLRHGNFFKLFDSKEKLLGSFEGVTNGVGLELAKIFDFNLTLTNRFGQSTTPPPAYLFVPYYIDQDLSWNAKLSGFNGLGQFTNWKKDVIEYHMGIRPDDYYKFKSMSAAANVELKEIERELSILKNIEKRHEKQMQLSEFNINFDEFKEQIAKLLLELEPLKLQQGKYKESLKTLYSEKHRVQKNIRAAKETNIALSKDLEFCEDSGENISCPTCGSEYENSFEERMALAQDLGDVAGFLLELQQELNSVESKIREIEDRNRLTSKDIQVIEESLSDKKEKITLFDLIRSAGARESTKVLGEEKDSIGKKKLAKETEIEKFEEEKRKFEDPEHIKEVRNSYTEFMGKFLHELEVFNLAESAYKNTDTSLDETGSDLPRALVAYFYAFVYTVREKNSNGFLSPIVIDSPNTGGQDEYRLPLLYKFITDKTPDDVQLILGAESLPPNFQKDKYNIIKVEQQYSLLQESDYPVESALFSTLISEVN